MQNKRKYIDLTSPDREEHAEGKDESDDATASE